MTLYTLLLYIPLYPLLLFFSLTPLSPLTFTFQTPDQASDVVMCALLQQDLDKRGILYLDNCQESESKRALTYMGNHQDRLYRDSCHLLGLTVTEKDTEWIEEITRVEKMYGVQQEEEK